MGTLELMTWRVSRDSLKLQGFPVGYETGIEGKSPQREKNLQGLNPSLTLSQMKKRFPFNSTLVFPRGLGMQIHSLNTWLWLTVVCLTPSRPPHCPFNPLVVPLTTCRPPSALLREITYLYIISWNSYWVVLARATQWLCPWLASPVSDWTQGMPIRGFSGPDVRWPPAIISQRGRTMICLCIQGRSVSREGMDPTFSL